MINRALKFQNPIYELNINTLDEYLKIFETYGKGIFISTLADCKTRKYKIEERKNINFIRHFSKKTFDEIVNNCPFNLYIIDTFYKAFAVLKVEKVYFCKKDIPKEEYDSLIPPLIKDFIGHAYFKFNDINIFPYEFSNKIININSQKPLFDTKQINPGAPWYVEPIDGILGEYFVQEAKKENNNTLPFTVNPNYCVYRYYINLLGNEMNYIGMTKDLSSRYYHHSTPSFWNSKNEKEKLLYLAFKNIGYDKFSFEVLHDNLTEDEAHFWEAKEIHNYNAYYPFGFNVRNEDKYLNNTI